MSNTNDPKPTSPQDPDKRKPTDADADEGRTGGSSYEFQLPGDVKSYSELPPIPQPETGDSANQVALPPRPTAERPATGTFDFIDLDAEMAKLSDPDVRVPPAAPTPPTAPALFTPTPNAVDLPPAAPVEPPLLSTDGAVVLPELPVPAAGDGSTRIDGVPMAFSASSSDFDFGPAASVTPPAQIPEAFAASLPDVDLGGGTERDLPAIPQAFPASSGEVNVPPPEDQTIPEARAASEPDLDLGDATVVMPDSVPDGVLASSMDIELEPPTEAPQPPTGFATSSAEVDLAATEGGELPTIPQAFTASSADIDLGELPAALLAEPASDTGPVPTGAEEVTDVGSVPDIGQLYRTAEPPSATDIGGLVPTAEPTSATDIGTLFPVAEPASAVDLGQEAAPTDPPSSFVLGQSEAPAAPRAPSEPVISLLLPPPVLPSTDPSMGSMESMGSLSVPDISVLYPAAPTEPPAPFEAGDSAVADLELPPGVPGVPDSNVGLGDQLKPVDPASGWLDSGVLDAAKTAGTALPAAARPPESSDIFSGARSGPAAPIEPSDVIVATAFGAAAPVGADQPPEPGRPSDVALTFDGPPGGSTLPAGDSGNLPMADELAGDSGVLLPGDDESIHDFPDPAQDPLFDSAKLADAPDLPAAKAPDDAPDFGSAPGYSSDASSILADLATPPDDDGLGSSSSVRVEAPGVDRTLTGSPAEGAFDLTVPDEPIPADLFGESTDDPDADANDWRAQSGSGLLDHRTSVEMELDATEGALEPADIDLGGDEDPSPSAQSSIFSGSKPPPDAGAVEPTESDVGDLAEFSPSPDLDDTNERAKDQPPAAHRPSPSDFELPESPETAVHRAGASGPEDEGGAIDWDAVSDDENATRGIPQDASLSALMRELTDGSNETPTKDAAPVEGGVTVDWMAGSGEGSAVVEPAKTAPTAKKGKGREPEPDFSEKPTKPSKVEPAPKGKGARGRTPPADDTGSGSAEVAKTKPTRKGGGMLVGMLLGGLLVGGGAAGAYFGDLLPKQSGTGPGGTAIKPPVAPPVTTGEAPAPRAALLSGDAAKAVELVKAKPAESADEQATAGYVLVYAHLQGNGTEADREQGRKELRAAIDATDKETDAAKKAESIERAVRATVVLGISYEAAGNTDTARKLFTEAKIKYPGHSATFDAHLDRMGAGGRGTSFNAPGRLTPAEAERIVLSVAVLLADDGPKAKEPEEPGSYYWKAVKLANEGKYPEAIEQIGKAKAAHVKRARALAGRGLNPLTDPLEQMFPRACDEMAAGWRLRGDLYNHPATADAARKGTLTKALDALSQGEKDLTNAKAEAAKLEKEVAVAKADAVKLDKDLKATEKAKTEAEDKLKTAAADLKTAAADLKTAQADLKTAQTGLQAAEKDAKDKAGLIAAIAAELKPAKVLPEKWGPADLVAGAKTAAGLASGADAQRVVKAEAAAKAAVAETKALATKYDTDTKKLKDDHAADLKKLEDSYAADLKKLKDANAEELTKLTDKYKGDAKKRAEAHEVALKAEQAKTDDEKKKAAAQAVALQKQLANVIAPAQAVDLWLPILAELRRPADADPAMALAARALASSVPDSEDEAKARTATGMALLLKNDLSGAKAQFQAARRSPAYKAAAGKYWTKVADNGLDATEDPLALYRAPVVIPPVDPRAATKALDAGISAYKAGRYDAAAAALADAAKYDPTDPVAWYYLGAARWAKGDEAQARKDFSQGAERERSSSVTGRTVSAALAAIQGRARDAIDKTRP